MGGEKSWTHDVDLPPVRAAEVFVGFESLSDENLADAGKRTSKVADYARRVRIFHDVGIQMNGSFVFERTVRWIEEQRLECATFHVLTPYPGTPLFRQLKKQGRLLHRDWNLYDTAHAVFQPRHLSPEELEAGCDWCYRELFSTRSIWRRRPAQLSAVPPYLAMSYLYKRSNRLWRLLIEKNLTAAVWSPLVEATRRRRLAARTAEGVAPVSIPAGA